MTYEEQLERLARKKDLYEKRATIRQIKRSMKKAPSTTKFLMAYIFLNCTAVEIYSMWVMWELMDLSALYALITAVVTESLSFAVYAWKAFNETKQEEIIRLERDKMELEDDSSASGLNSAG